MSPGKYMTDHLTFDWCVYFSRPIHYSRTLVCGLFKKLWFSCRRFFKVPLPILLTALLLACRLRRQNFISCALTIPPATQATNARGNYWILWYSRSGGKHSNASHVFTFMLYPFLRALQQNRAQSRLLYLLIKIQLCSNTVWRTFVNVK